MTAMTTPPSPILIGALAPLSPPGWAAAGRHLVAGLELAVRDLNSSGGVDGRPLKLLVRDTAADPMRATAAVDEFADVGAAAVVGEFHSVVARAAAAQSVVRHLPFVCSSAVLDALTDEPTDLVARIAPPQSRGWTLYADYLRSLGHAHIAVVAQPSIYWAAGGQILSRRLVVTKLTPDQLTLPGPRILAGATAVLLLTGHPEPALSLVRSIRRDHPDVLIGAPAGQPELPEWCTPEGAGIPFLRYLPSRFTSLGGRVAADLPRSPSFVAFEGYDAVKAVAEFLRARAWSEVDVEGTRGRITFRSTPELPTWQWTWSPLQIADRDPADPTAFRVLRSG